MKFNIDYYNTSFLIVFGGLGIDLKNEEPGARRLTLGDPPIPFLFLHLPFSLDFNIIYLFIGKKKAFNKSVAQVRAGGSDEAEPVIMLWAYVYRDGQHWLVTPLSSSSPFSSPLPFCSPPSSRLNRTRRLKMSSECLRERSLR